MGFGSVNVPGALSAEQVGAVPSSRTINGKSLTRDITLGVGDVGGSNPNLLYNWYFVDPINQRVQMEYSGKGYTIDRWYSFNSYGTVTIEDDGVKFSRGDSYAIFHQRLPDLYILGKTVTLSVLISDTSPGATFIPQISMCNSVGGYMTNLYYRSAQSGAGLFSVTANVAETIADSGFNVGIRIPSTAPDGSWIKIAAMKLELGDQQTLAHQDSDGNWVLNDPPPNKALELAKCQRYYVRFSNPEDSGMPTSTITDSLVPHQSSNNYLNGPIVLPVPMRATPSVSFFKIGIGTLHQTSGVDDADGTLRAVEISNNVVQLNYNKSGISVNKDSLQKLFVKPGGYISFSADL